MPVMRLKSTHLDAVIRDILASLEMAENVDIEPFTLLNRFLAILALDLSGEPVLAARTTVDKAT